VLVVAALGITLACAAKDAPAIRSHAADTIIDEATTAAERADLIRVRDEVDAAARDRIAELDAEIATLERENASLRRRSRSTN
jgi:ubiquinone biosynthesis protein UbiJ